MLTPGTDITDTNGKSWTILTSEEGVVDEPATEHHGKPFVLVAVVPAR